MKTKTLSYKVIKGSPAYSMKFIDMWDSFWGLGQNPACKQNIQIWHCRCLLNDMKAKVILIFAVVASLTIGFLAGRIQTVTWYREHVIRPYILQRDAGNAGYYSQVLTSLRSGHQADASNSLERSLDLALASLQHLPASAATGDIRSAILLSRDYRAKYPVDKTSPELEPRIQKVLSLVQ